MVLQNKTPIGTPVDFKSAVEIKNLQKLSYRDDVVGVLAIQSAPVTIDSATRDACFNGNLADVQNQIDGQGMTTRYATLSWNETQNPDGSYYITDFQMGVVVQIVRDYNTGASYVVTSFQAVSWLKQIMDKLPTSFKAWNLKTPTRNIAHQQWVEEMVSEQKWVGAPIGQPIPDLPIASDVKATILAQGDFNTALGTFVTQLSDKGVAVAFPADAYGVDVCFYQSPIGNIPGGYRGYYYQVYCRFWWDCTTNPDITIIQSALFWLGIAFILALAGAVGLAIALPIVAYNLTHSDSYWKKYDENGNLIEEGGGSGPPDWFAWVIPVVALGLGGLIIYKLIPQRRRSEE